MKDCVIIGAGFSGLTAARELSKQGVDFSILEASGRIGGRVYNEKYKGTNVEIGARYIGDQQTEIIQLLDHYGLGKQQVVKKGIMLLRSEGESIPMESEEENTSPEMMAFYEEVEQLANEVDFVDFQSSPKALELDKITIVDWMRSKKLSYQSIAEMRGFCHGLLCCEPEDASVLSLLWYIASSKGLFNAVDHENGLLKYIADDTLSALAESISAEYKDRIVCDCQVIAVNEKVNHFEVITNREIRYAKQVLFAIPPKALSRILLPDSVSQEQKRAFYEFNPGNAFACFAVFDKPFWKEKGLSGTIIGDGWVSTTIDVSNELQEVGILDCMLSPGKSVEFSTFSLQKQKKLIIQDIRDYLGDPKLEPLEIYIGNWHNEFPYFGSFGWKLAPGYFTNQYGNLRKEVPGIFFAGTEFSVEFPGYVEGAIRSGKAQALRIIDSQNQY